MQIINSIGYKIYPGNSCFKELTKFLKRNAYSNYYVICDEITIKECLPILVSNCKELKGAEIFEMEVGEKSKSLPLCSHVWQTLLDYKADRNSLIINLGGGVISDLGGFIASTYKRGIDFINIPTSLLAMADAAVGGKTGIDFGGIKNSVGTITQPKAVFVFYDFLKTLPSRHVYNGLAEVYKIALINDKVFWKKLANASKLKESDRDAIIYKSIQLKNAIVQKDPFEKNIRKALNFGHTIGHAVESVLLESDFELLHGEAVVVGMMCETWIAFKKKLINGAQFNEICETLNFVFNLNPIPPKAFKPIEETLLNDKKNSKGIIQMALIHGIGNCKIEVPVEKGWIKGSLEFYNAFVK